MQYRLNDKQKELLKSLVPGLKDGSMKTEWTLTHGNDGIGHIFGLTDPDGSLWRKVWKGVSRADFNVFEKYGFFSTLTNDYGVDVGYSLDAGLIIDVVESDFEIPDYMRPGGDNIQTGDIINVAIGPNASSITNLQASSPVSDQQQFEELKYLINQLYEKLSQIQEEESEKRNAIDKSIQTILDQIQEKRPDRHILNISLEGLRQAASDVRTVAGLAAIADQIAQLIRPLL